MCEGSGCGADFWRPKIAQPAKMPGRKLQIVSNFSNTKTLKPDWAFSQPQCEMALPRGRDTVAAWCRASVEIIAATTKWSPQ
jgi:hypothetical protein